MLLIATDRVVLRSQQESPVTVYYWLLFWGWNSQ